MKKLLWIGLFIALFGISTYLWTAKPWVQKNKMLPEKTISETLPVPRENTQENIPVVTPVEVPQPEEGMIDVQQFLDAGLYSQAIRVSKEYLIKNPNNIQALEALHTSYVSTKNFYEAEKIARLLFAQTNSTVHHIYLINTLLLGGKIDDANSFLSTLSRSLEKKYYELIIAIAQENTEQIKSLAQELSLSNDPKYKKIGDDVLQVYKTYGSFRDGSPHYLRMMLANILNILEFHTIVTQFVRPTLAEYDDYRDAWILAGNAYLNLRQFRRAEEMLSRAVSLDPSHDKSPYYLAIALTEQGQTENAIEQFKNSLANGYTPQIDVHRYIGDIYFRQHKFDDAFEFYQKVLEDPDATIEDYSKAMYIVLSEQDSPALGLKLSTQVVKKFPNEAKPYSLLAWALIRSGDYTKALTAIEAGRKHDDSLPDLYLYAGQIYQGQGQNQSALQAYRDCFERGNRGALASECAKRYNSLRETLQSQ